jgi:hypothetical protein
MRTDANDLSGVRDPAIQLLLAHTATLTDEGCLTARHDFGKARPRRTERAES